MNKEQNFEPLKDQEIEALEENKKKISELVGDITEEELDTAAEAIAKEREEQTPIHLSDVIDFKNIYHVKGKSGLWQPFKVLGKGRNKAFAFFNLYEPKIKTTALKGAISIGASPQIVAAFDIAYIRGMEVEDTLGTIEGIASGTIKRYSKYYKIVVAYYQKLVEDIDKEELDV